MSLKIWMKYFYKISPWQNHNIYFHLLENLGIPIWLKESYSRKFWALYYIFLSSLWLIQNSIWIYWLLTHYFTTEIVMDIYLNPYRGAIANCLKCNWLSSENIKVKQLLDFVCAVFKTTSVWWLIQGVH